MEKIPVLLVRSRKDTIFDALTERVGASQRFSLYQGRTWLDTELADVLAGSRPIACALVVLVCPSERNEALSAAILAGHPRLVVVRIDVDARASAMAESINVDLVQHIRLDQRRLGFDRLLSAMQYLVEHHGTGDAERLARFLVLDDPRSQDGTDVRFLRVPPRRDERCRDGKLPAPALRWLNALLREYFSRYPLAEDGSLSVSRSRAMVLIDALEAGATPPGEQRLQTEDELIAQIRNPGPAPHTLMLLQQRLALGEDALLSLIICLAPEVDLGYQLIFGHIQDDMMRRCASGSLIDALRFGHGAATAAASVARLIDWRLLIAEGAHAPAAEQSLRVDPAIVQWLFVSDKALLADPPVRAATLADTWTGGQFLYEAADKEMRDKLVAQLIHREPGWEWAVLTGPDSDGWRALLEVAAAKANTGLLRVSLARIAALETPAREDTVIRLARAACLMDWHTAVDCAGEVIDAAALSTIVDAHAAHAGLCLMIAPDARVAASTLARGRWRVFSRSTPAMHSRIEHFRIVLASLGIRLETPEITRVMCERLATAYPLSVSGMHAAEGLARAELIGESPADDGLRVLGAACRRVAAPDILRLARRIEPTGVIDDVIVPPDRTALLKEIVANTRHGRVVLDDWGFGSQLAYGRGVAALFSGPSGTGKTMAAQAIACELGVDVFAVDLSRIVSKYIGETEKHLDSVITDAERSGSVLLFDEADALFGKRSEVKDAHDRYANIEVAYLLQRMEAFSGLAILTTNSRQNLDQAFLRRLRFIVDFPRPDAAAREKIWRKCMPKAAPIVTREIDWPMLARFDLSGGVIRQVTLRAAFLAACKTPAKITMVHLLGALRAELNKLGMQSAEREVDEYQLALGVQGDKAA